MAARALLLLLAQAVVDAEPADSAPSRPQLFVRKMVLRRGTSRSWAPPESTLPEELGDRAVGSPSMPMPMLRSACRSRQAASRVSGGHSSTLGRGPKKWAGSTAVRLRRSTG